MFSEVTFTTYISEKPENTLSNPLTFIISMNIIYRCDKEYKKQQNRNDYTRRCQKWQYLKGKHRRQRQAAEKLLT